MVQRARPLTGHIWPVESQRVKRARRKTIKCFRPIAPFLEDRGENFDFVVIFVKIIRHNPYYSLTLCITHVSNNLNHISEMGLVIDGKVENSAWEDDLTLATGHNATNASIAVNLAHNTEKRPLVHFWPFSLRIFFQNNIEDKVQMQRLKTVTG